MSAEQQSPHVLIIGAGVSGLVLAHGLKKVSRVFDRLKLLQTVVNDVNDQNGVSFEIFEREESAMYYRPREWGVGVHWALPMLRELLPDELSANLHSATTHPFFVCPPTGMKMPVFNVETGEILKEIPLPEFIRFSRRKLRALCATGLKVNYGKTLKDVDFSQADEVLATFQDGSTTKGNVIVGADGTSSTLRALLFPNGEGLRRPIPYGGINMHACYNDAAVSRLLHEKVPVLGLGMHPRGYWLWLSPQEMPGADQPQNWVFQLMWTWKSGPETDHLATLDLAELKKEAASCFGEPFLSAWTSLPADSVIPENRVSIWDPRPVPDSACNGRAVLMGDAAHAMSFHRGQGMNHAINDATTLVKELSSIKGGKSAVEAVACYEREMIARAGEEVRVSATNTEMVHDWQKLLESPFMQRGSDRN